MCVLKKYFFKLCYMTPSIVLKMKIVMRFNFRHYISKSILCLRFNKKENFDSRVFLRSLFHQKKSTSKSCNKKKYFFFNCLLLAGNE